jgi:mevalonate kinase
MIGVASAKAILCGEHAVVHGVPAVAVGLPRGATARARLASPATILLGAKQATVGDGSDAARAFQCLLDVLEAPPCAVEVTLNIPAGVGLGASAAIAVATARAVSATMGHDPSLDQVVEAAMAWEKVFHGNPSGIDATAAAHGGCLRFQRREGAKPVRVGHPLTFAIAVAGPAASTKEMVEGVARLAKSAPEKFQMNLDAIRALVENAVLCIEAGDVPSLGQLLDLNQMLLAGMFVSTPALENACAIARSAGAHGAKLTGAGGGGCVLALTDTDPSPILDAWKNKGIECFATTIPQSGDPANHE